MAPFSQKKNKFLGFSRANISVAVGNARPVFWAVFYILDIKFWENFNVIAQGHHTFLRVDMSEFWHFGRCLRPVAPILTPEPWHYIPGTMQYTLRTQKLGFPGPFSFGDIKERISSCVQWHCQHWACRTCVTCYIW